MLIPLSTDLKRFLLDLEISADYPMQVSIVVFDPTYPYTFYYKRKINFGASQFSSSSVKRNLSIPFPVSSPQLCLGFFEKGAEKEAGFEIVNIQTRPLPDSNNWATPERHRFMDFAIRFAQKAGYAQPGYYSNPKEEFLIHYKTKLVDEQGTELVTPARIHQKIPWVQLSQNQFRQFSIPVRIAILAHEACHFFWNTRSEKEADLCGLQYYLDAGFPKIEAVYAITKVFRFFELPIEREHLQRAKDIIQFISNYRSSEAPTLSTITEIK